MATSKSPSAPLYDVGDLVYVRESAVLGFLESYKIENIVYDRETNHWLYEVNIRNTDLQPKRPLNTFRISSREVLFLREDELIIFCVAIDIAVKKTEEELDALEVKRLQCVLDSSSSSSSSSTAQTSSSSTSTESSSSQSQSESSMSSDSSTSG